MGALVCPTILAHNAAQFSKQLRNIASFAKRIQIDLMDGEFTESTSLGVESIRWDPIAEADIHLMFKNPSKKLDSLIHKQPNMIIIHAESNAHHMYLAAQLHKENIKAGLALLPQTTVSEVEDILHSFDHMLIFSGELGKFGGKADLKLLEKARQAKKIFPQIEIGWDGGVNLQNASELVGGGVDVLNVGGSIQKASNPEDAYKQIVSSISLHNN